MFIRCFRLPVIVLALFLSVQPIFAEETSLYDCVADIFTLQKESLLAIESAELLIGAAVQLRLFKLTGKTDCLKKAEALIKASRALDGASQLATVLEGTIEGYWAGKETMFGLDHLDKMMKLLYSITEPQHWFVRFLRATILHAVAEGLPPVWEFPAHKKKAMGIAKEDFQSVLADPTAVPEVYLAEARKILDKLSAGG
jgi:hypothetical protein